MNRTITITNGDKTYSGRIGVITGTTLGIEDHGIMTCYLNIEFDGGGIGVGGHALDTPFLDNHGDFVRREGSAYGLDLIMWIIKTVSVNSWENLKGQKVIVLFDGDSMWGSKAVGIAHTIDESKILVFDDHYESWSENHSDEIRL